MRSFTHSSATLLSASFSPGMVAHPCFFTYSVCSHVPVSFRPLSFWAFWPSSLNWTTHMGPRRLATAFSSPASAIFLAVPPVTQPPHVKPIIIVSTIDAMTAQNTAVFVGRAALQRCPIPGLASTMIASSSYRPQALQVLVHAGPGASRSLLIYYIILLQFIY